MPGRTNNPKGRPKGAKNKDKGELVALAEKLGVNPFEILLHFAKGDWKALGYDSETRSRWTNAGIEYEEEIIKAETRMNAAKEASKYMYPQKKAVEVSTDPENGFVVCVKDYTGS